MSEMRTVLVDMASRLFNDLCTNEQFAIGFAQEYPLHRSTRRLWSWRDEFGSETEWAGWVGRVVARVGGNGLWPLLVSDPKTIPSI